MSTRRRSHGPRPRANPRYLKTKHVAGSPLKRENNRLKYDGNTGVGSITWKRGPFQAVGFGGAGMGPVLCDASASASIMRQVFWREEWHAAGSLPIPTPLQSWSSWSESCNGFFDPPRVGAVSGSSGMGRSGGILSFSLPPVRGLGAH